MSQHTATAQAHPNIALIKYWGKRDIGLNLPAVPSLSLTLSGFATTTTVTWGAPVDALMLNHAQAPTQAAQRVFRFLDRLDVDRPPCHVQSHNNFPTGAGLASSASAFAALALAATQAKGDPLDSVALSVLARQGSGSACRSIWGGFVEWRLGQAADGHDSHGMPLHTSEPWPLVMVIGVVSNQAKAVGSSAGMASSSQTSPWYAQWVAQAPQLLAAAKEAIAQRDLDALGRCMEVSTLQMHAVMQLAEPPLLYWKPATVAAMHAIWALRASGTSAWLTMDAGPQVKVLCHPEDAARVAQVLKPHTRAIHTLAPGPGAQLLSSS